MKHKIEKLRHFPVLTIDKQSMMRGKHRLLTEINRRQEVRGMNQQSFAEAAKLFYLRFVRRMIPRSQLVVALLLIFFVSVSTSFMAQAAVPGDVLWPIKLTLEKAEVTLALDSEQESRVHIRHVGNRLRELSVISQQQSASAGPKIKQVVRRLEKDMTAANQSLKITKDEKKSFEPQVIAALAKDLSVKADEANKVLEENKKALSAQEGDAAAITIEAIAGLANPSSTEPLLPVVTETAEATTTPDAAKPQIPITEPAEVDVRQAINEVQLVNDYISYNALKAMVEMVERRSAGNRFEVTGFLRERIGQQRERRAALADAVQLVDDNFILHRAQARTLLQKAVDLLEQAETRTTLDNLSGALSRLNSAKDAIGQAAGILQEAASAGGIKAKDAEPKQATKAAAPQPLQIQSIPNPELVEPAVTDEAGEVPSD